MKQISMPPNLQINSLTLCERLFTTYFLLAVIIAVAAGCASVKDTTSQVPDKIDPDQGMMVLVIDSTVGFQRLKFKRSGDVFETAAATDVGQGRTVRFIELAPGTYHWSSLEFSSGQYYSELMDFTDGDKDLVFTIKAGTVSYPGDLLIRGVGNGRYHVRLLDHAAMLLSDINQQQKGLIARYGIVYTGTQTDRFYDYYNSLHAPASVGTH